MIFWPFPSTILDTVLFVEPIILSLVSIENSVMVFLTFPVPVQEEERKLKLLFSHFFVVAQKILWML